MRVAISTVQIPFINGGAEIHAKQLKKAIGDFGYEVDIITMPFVFSPLDKVVENIDIWKKVDFDGFDVGKIDKLISLRFPSYNIRHDYHVLWVLHQHRSVYDLYGTKFGEENNLNNNVLVEKIKTSDREAFLNAKKLYANSKNVSYRMKKFNNIEAAPLYHPPQNAELFYNEGFFPFVYFPSRLELLKRQDLLIRAMQYVKDPIVAIISGNGGEKDNYQKLINDLDLSQRVRLVGHVSLEQQRKYYANSLAVFYGPYDEDYGYVTLEAMLSGKVVITCNDSGGPTEFVVDGETGFVVEPDPKYIADAINKAWGQLKTTINMGFQGRDNYYSKGISWNNVVSKLLG